MAKGVCELTPRLLAIRRANMQRCNELGRERKIRRIQMLHALGMGLNGQPFRGRDPVKQKAKQLRAQAKGRLCPDRRYLARLRGFIRNSMRKREWGRTPLPISPRSLRTYIDLKLSEHERRCPACRVSLDLTGFHIDHIIPLASASDKEELLRLCDLDNLDVLCPRCNLRKHAKREVYA